MSYILIFSQAFLAALVRFAVEGLRGLHRVLLVCNLPTEEVAGLRWVREGIGRIDLPGESLIQRRHSRSSPDRTVQSMSEVQTPNSDLLEEVGGADLLVFLCASVAGSQFSRPGWSKRDKVKTLS